MTQLPDKRIGTAILTPDGTVTRVLDIPDRTLNMVCTVWSPDDGRLACEAWDESDPSRDGIYTVRASDGGGMVRITDPPSGKSDLPGDYSPDGNLLLFKRGEGENSGPLMVVPTAGGKPTGLPIGLVDDPGRYSPDGKNIVTSLNGRLLLLDGAGHLREEIMGESHGLFGPAWSTDGSRIAYSRASAQVHHSFKANQTGPFADIWTSRPDGTDPRQVTSTPDKEIVVEWGGS